ncbi:MAG: hypothetical protein KKE20_04550 [Nanoarchaeota archaeon]|nr:hypothetical protein [Nanoarchaeota archaeon]
MEVAAQINPETPDYTEAFRLLFSNLGINPDESLVQSESSIESRLDELAEQALQRIGNIDIGNGLSITPDSIRYAKEDNLRYIAQKIGEINQKLSENHDVQFYDQYIQSDPYHAEESTKFIESFLELLSNCLLEHYDAELIEDTIKSYDHARKELDKANPSEGRFRNRSVLTQSEKELAQWAAAVYSNHSLFRRAVDHAYRIIDDGIRQAQDSGSNPDYHRRIGQITDFFEAHHIPFSGYTLSYPQKTNQFAGLATLLNKGADYAKLKEFALNIKCRMDEISGFLAQETPYAAYMLQAFAGTRSTRKIIGNLEALSLKRDMIVADAVEEELKGKSTERELIRLGYSFGSSSRSRYSGGGNDVS